MSTEKSPKKESPKRADFSFSRFFLKSLYFLGGCALCIFLMGYIAVKLTWDKLPDLHAMTDYRPSIPLRVYTSDHVLLAEFGEERRDVVPFAEIPTVMKKALLAAEDNGFYTHGGVDWPSVARAALANIASGEKAQGASTITMQVARNFYLSSKKSFLRKFYELLLTYKIEDQLSKDQILELYMNQIYLGHRSYGFAAAAHTYFGVPLSKITLAQAAILAGIPKAPSRFNPITSMKHALQRQHYVLSRMLALGDITQQQYEEAKNEKIVIARDNEALRIENAKFAVHGEYVAELARQLMYNVYKSGVYTRGLNVYTTVSSKDQELAYHALRDGVLSYTRRRPYPGPVAQLILPPNIENDESKLQEFLSEVLRRYPDSDDLQTYVVLSASPQEVVAVRQAGNPLILKGKALSAVHRALSPKASSKLRIQRGSVIYVQSDYQGGPAIINMPTVEGAFVAMDPHDGAIKAMVGGFDFNRGDFNRVTQAWRQPGSTFKPFVYAAAMERGVTPQTVVSDLPFYLSAQQTRGKPWSPKNYGNHYEPYMTVRQGLYKSVNMVSIRILQTVGPDFATSFIQRFGFDPVRQPPKGAYLTMALGAGSVTPLQMATAYSAFANGGYRVNPYLIDHVEDATTGAILMKAQPAIAGNEKNRILDPRTAYIMQNLLHGVATSGTAARSTGILKRGDLAGKTGTTNKAFDAWFAGFTPKLVGISWMGFDNPRSLGAGETGGGLSMPIWIEFMKGALKGIPVAKFGPVPRGLTQNGDSFYYAEFPPGQYIASIGVGNTLPPGMDPNGNTIPMGTGVPTQTPSKDPIGHLINNFGSF